MIEAKLRSTWPIFLALTLATCMTVATIINGIMHFNSINNNDSNPGSIHHKKPSLMNSFSEDAIKSWMNIGDEHRQITNIIPTNISKKILYWNFNSSDTNDRNNVMTLATCPVYPQCQLINRFDVDDLRLSDYDTIIFRYKDLDFEDLPRERWSSQLYVLYEVDSPMHHSDVADKLFKSKIPPNYFNWTMGYRSDSDVVVPISGKIELLDDPPSTQLHRRYQVQDKIAAWVVTDDDCSLKKPKNGRWDQKELINQLKIGGVPVDIIRQSDCGYLESIDDCGKSRINPTLPPKYERKMCQLSVASDYKFYLAMEDTLCPDYITDKFFTMLEQSIVPVVMDLHGHYAKVAPPHSYINAKDFRSIKDLAKYLIRLDQDDRLYNEYFVWKKYFRVRNRGSFVQNHHLCNLCAALANPSYNSHKSHKNVGEWLLKKANCKSVDFHGFQFV